MSDVETRRILQLAKTGSCADELRDGERLGRSSAKLADNAQWVTETSDQMMRVKDHTAGPSTLDAKSTVPRRTNRLHKPVVILAGVFANRILSTVEQRFAVRIVSDEFIDFDKVDFTDVSLAIVFGCGHRISERHLNKATFINFHGSLLPLGRGPHPHIWNWINGEPHGVTIHKMTAEMDKGPIIVQRKVELEPWASSINSTMYTLVDSATELFRENWDDLADGSFKFKSTDPRLGSGSSHRFKDTQEIRDVVNRFASAPIPIFLREVKARMAVSSSPQPRTEPHL